MALVLPFAFTVLRVSKYTWSFHLPTSCTHNRRCRGAGQGEFGHRFPVGTEVMGSCLWGGEFGNSLSRNRILCLPSSERGSDLN